MVRCIQRLKSYLTETYILISDVYYWRTQCCTCWYPVVDKTWMGCEISVAPPSEWFTLMKVACGWWDVVAIVALWALTACDCVSLACPEVSAMVTVFICWVCRRDTAWACDMACDTSGCGMTGEVTRGMAWGCGCWAATCCTEAWAWAWHGTPLGWLRSIALFTPCWETNDKPIKPQAATQPDVKLYFSRTSYFTCSWCY